MNFEPQKFYIGLMDFFSILLPGALLTYMMMDVVGPVLLAGKYLIFSVVEGWSVFLVSSYLFGHLVFLVGSWLDNIYDKARIHTINKQILLLAKRGKLLNRFSRFLIGLVFKQERDIAVERAGEIKRQMLGPLQAGSAINTFQWSKAYLSLESPACLANVQRFEADSKFFRCLVIVLMILVAKWLYGGECLLAGFATVMILLAFWRYMEQRYKATNQAYWSVITLVAKDKKMTLDKPVPKPGGPNRAGGVVYRIIGWCRIEWLLVEAKDDPQQWVLPKGHIEGKEVEDLRITAVREVFEETGVWGKICENLGPVSYTVKGEVATTQFYLMRYAGCGLKEDVNREHRWLTIENMSESASYLETRDLLKLAESKLKHAGVKPKPLACYVVEFLKRIFKV